MVTVPHICVTADNKTMTLGGTPPQLTATISGFLNGDVASTSVTGLPDCATPAISLSTIGMYPITCTPGTLVSRSYDFGPFASGSLAVVYRWGGFSQPINDTTYNPRQAPSVFKAGSTVPVKFQLRNAFGTPVQASTSPLWLTPQRGAAMSAAVDESTYSDPATSGTSYRWDPPSQQYIYNWSTKGLTARYWYKVFAQLDDGKIYSVFVGLK